MTGLLTLRSVNERLPYILAGAARWPVIVTDVVGVDDQGDILFKIIRPADNHIRYAVDTVGASLINYGV